MADTVCNIPYQALGPELSADTREREKLYMVFYFFQYIGTLFASMAPVVIQHFLTNCDCKKCEIITDVLKKSNCIAKCKSSCSVDNNEMSLLVMCMFVGVFFVISIVLLCYSINERRESYNKKEDSYFVPTIFRMLHNQPFMRLLLPWILDATITQIFATMLPFFVNFVVNPMEYCKKNNIDLNDAVCSVNNWVGLTIFAFFVFVVFATYGWHLIISCVGKKKVWLSYSLMSMITFSLFLFCDEGALGLMVLFSIINSFPAGAGYINDVFVSDCIDYDEFITGKRNEGIYTVFSSYTPKLVGIFAQSIPLTVMSCKFL